MTRQSTILPRRAAMPRRALAASLLVLAVLTALPPAAEAGPLRERLQQRAAERAAPQADGAEEGLEDGRTRTARRVELPPGARLLRDVAYGSDPRQRMDVYLPAHAQGAPVLFLVHGGGWRHGDKAHGRLVQNKVAHWVGQGVVLVSVNYRMLPDALPDTQVRDVALALAQAQQQAATWGGDARRFVLMGHSAGAHLVSLLAASPEGLRAAGVQPVLGTVALDSGAMDVEQTLQARHAPLFDAAFGSDPAFWRAVSPQHQLRAGATPWLAVCSSQRRMSCPQARQFAALGQSLGVRVEVLPQDLSHGEINEQIGLPGPYTGAVDAFLHTLPGWQRP